MDKWKDSELEKMRVGGNQKAQQFFQSQPDYKSDWSFQDKYNSKAAALLRDKVATEAEGGVWSAATSPARNYQAPTSNNHSAFKTSNSSGISSYQQQSYSNNSDADNFENWLNDTNENQKNFQRQSFPNEYSSNQQPNNKYVGFGNGPISQSCDLEDGNDSLMKTLQTSWSSFAIGATKFASAAAKQTSKLAAQASKKTMEVGHQLNGKVQEMSHKGWSNLNGYWNGPSSSETNMTRANENASLLNARSAAGGGNFDSSPPHMHKSASYHSSSSYQSYNYEDDKPKSKGSGGGNWDDSNWSSNNSWSGNNSKPTNRDSNGIKANASANDWTDWQENNWNSFDVPSSKRK